VNILLLRVNLLFDCEVQDDLSFKDKNDFIQNKIKNIEDTHNINAIEYYFRKEWEK